jgi:hypothetical protein
VLDPLYDTNEVMWEIFLVGAPAYLLKKIDPAKVLVSGTPVTLHSLSFTATSTLAVHARPCASSRHWQQRPTRGKVVVRRRRP